MHSSPILLHCWRLKGWKEEKLGQRRGQSAKMETRLSIGTHTHIRAYRQELAMRFCDSIFSPWHITKGFIMPTIRLDTACSVLIITVELKGNLHRAQIGALLRKQFIFGEQVTRLRYFTNTTILFNSNTSEQFLQNVFKTLYTSRFNYCCICFIATL